MIKREKPPNYEQIAAAFQLNGREIFAYDGVIYAPGTGVITPELVVHETVHFKQQEVEGVESWWKKYIDDPEFRMAQEIPAHKLEYRAFLKTHKDRNERVRYLELVANRLSSKMYGNVITKKQALCQLNSQI
jgi:hypothetical protein